MHLRGEETSLNPLGLAEALIGAMQHSAVLYSSEEDKARVFEYTERMRSSMHDCMVAGLGTRDLSGPSGLTTEGFIDQVAKRMAGEALPVSKADAAKAAMMKDVDVEAIKGMFAEYDLDKNGHIDAEEFAQMVVKLGVAPMKGSSKM